MTSQPAPGALSIAPGLLTSGPQPYATDYPVRASFPVSPSGRSPAGSPAARYSPVCAAGAFDDHSFHASEITRA